MTFSLLPLIYKKRVGTELSKEEIVDWVQSLLSKDSAPDYQIASLLAFIFMNGMNREETSALTSAMRFSGEQFKYRGFPKDAFFIDKHSTGGVGDKISIPLFPIITAANERIHVPTIAGRGLGHTGGTVDKLESAFGFRCGLKPAQFYKQLKKLRLAFLSQTSKIAPADRRLYHLRDVTGTVESVPLITASILSKKLSESLHFLLLDLKFGSGAFLTNTKVSEELAESMIQVCRDTGQKAQVLMTKMDTPLGHYSGHRWELKESIEILKGEGPLSSRRLTLEMAQRMLQASGFSMAESLRAIDKVLSTGAAFDQLKNVIEAQGGSMRKLEAWIRKPPVQTKSVKASRDGTLIFDTRQVGLALTELGGGRKRLEDKIDFDVGFFHPKESGDRVQKGEEILKIYYRSPQKLRAAENWLKENAIQIRDEFFTKAPLIRKDLRT